MFCGLLAKSLNAMMKTASGRLLAGFLVLQVSAITSAKGHDVMAPFETENTGDEDAESSIVGATLYSTVVPQSSPSLPQLVTYNP